MGYAFLVRSIAYAIIVRMASIHFPCDICELHGISKHYEFLAKYV